MRRLPIIVSLILTLLLSQVPALMAGAQAQQNAPICFTGVPGITACIDPTFAGYWRVNGGLPVFGYPLTPTIAWATPEGPSLNVQWMERHRLELHPQSPPDYQVQLGRIGAERLAQLGRDWSAEPPEPGPQPGCLWFAETGRNVCDQAEGTGFRSYWERNGLSLPGLTPYQRSLALFGLPLTSAMPELGPDGTLILTQWFERARFEWHPANPANFRVLLGRLGQEVRAATPSLPTPEREIFGVEPNRGTVGATATRIAEGGFNWVRYNGVLWSEVEPQSGQRDWSQLQQVEQELTAIAEQGGRTMLVVRGTPAWAQARPDRICGPIRPEALAAFADFMGELVTRYSLPPYNVKYWELGNEPDVDYRLVRGDEPFGCWGDTDQPFYNGAAYAAMLKAVYPAIKAADPAAQVVVGGLLLYCDPARPSAAEPCQAGQFLEGVLRAGGGGYFDVLGYHSYVYWNPERRDWYQRAPLWDHLGGPLLGKRAMLMATLARYGYAKPLIMNEGGLLCYRADPACARLGFYQDQANHAVRLYTRVAASDLLGAIWYTLNGPGWQDGGMLDANQQPRPVFHAARFLGTQLRGARLIRTLGSGSLEGYAFAVGTRTVQIYWTNDGSQTTVPSPPSLRAIYSMLGEALPLTTDQISVGFEPIIIVAGS